MAGASVSFISPATQQMESLFDPKSLILSQFEFNNESFVFERGPRYKAYADLRESKLRRKMMGQEDSVEINLSPLKKQVRFQGSLLPEPTPIRRRPTSSLAQSVPDFSAVIRKENRKPANMLPPLAEKSATTPPAKSSSKMYGVGSRSTGGSRSANSLEKKGGGILARKSYASIEELRGISTAAANGIGRSSRGGGIVKGIMTGYRQ
ncbi:uncharacterized protein LOC124922466 [Impatiens glandulifera]|uniref:uncharacterized protein LOC124922466 n=1 Tax=Impatiens glandulifera TaxID=253017 RepID=UPI001FB199BD|nr:uncharacterized protein LOC124922466 [Impatiens glandulifera]